MFVLSDTILDYNLDPNLHQKYIRNITQYIRILRSSILLSVYGG